MIETNWRAAFIIISVHAGVRHACAPRAVLCRVCRDGVDSNGMKRVTTLYLPVAGLPCML